MKNTVTMAELMKKVTAYGQPQNLDEGFASDAQRRAAFASGYKEKGKKDKKEETLGEIKLSPPMIAKIKKTFEPLRDKKIGPGTQNKLMQTMDKIDKDKQTLVDLMNADIPFVSKLAVARLISKHNMKADQINKLRKEEVNEKFTKKDFRDNEDKNHHTENGVEIVNMFGTSAEKVKMSGIAARHNMKGSISSKDQKDRDALVKKYYPKLESVSEMSYKPGSFKDTRPQEKGAKAIDALIKSGGMDKKDFQKAKALYVQASDVASRTKLKNFIQDLDTEPLEALMDVIGRNDPNTFQQMYPNAKQGDYLSRIAFQHRKMKSEELDEKVDMQTKSYINDIARAMTKDKLMKPFADKFKKDAMKTGKPKDSLEDVLPDYIAGRDIAKLLNMGEEVELDERFSPKEIKMAIGIASDPRYAKGNMTGAVKAIEKMKRGLSDHPQVAAVLKRQNEDLDLVNAAANVLGEKLDKEDEPKVKKIIGKLKKASDAHAGQAKDLEKAISEDGHTDVASAIRQCKTIVEDATQMMPKLQSMNPEDALPTWWTNKLAVASNSMNKLRDYFLVPTSESLEDELDEMKEPFVVVDTADGNKVVGTASNEKEAKSIITSAELPPMKIKDKKTLKIMKSKKKQMIGQPFKEEVELDEKYDLYHKDFSSAMQHAYDYAKKKMGITIDPKEIDSKVATGPKKPSEGKTNTYRLKGRGGNLQIQVYNKGGSKPFELNMYKEESESMNNIKEWFTKNKCDVKVREIHEGSDVYQAYVPISKTIPNNLRYLTLENQYGMIPEDVENLEDINYKNIKETSITMNGDFWNKLLTAYEEKQNG
jgi:hypothetical protein